jgi:inosose dehydratase
LGNVSSRRTGKLETILSTARSPRKNFTSRIAKRARALDNSILIAETRMRVETKEPTMIANAKRIARRNFFSRAAVFGSSTLLLRENLRADDAERTIGLGFSLYGMKTLSLRAAIQTVAEIGYDCFELPVMTDWPADSARLSPDARRGLREQLGERSLRLTALMENLPALGDAARHRANLDRLKLAVELARDLSLDGRTPLVETILGGKAGEFEAVKEQLVERLRDWAVVAEQADVKLAIKAHISNATQQPTQLLWLIDSVASRSLAAAYDYSHFQLQGLDMKETIDTLLPKSTFIHVKDTEHAQGKRGFLLPGEGTIDYAQMFKLLGHSRYRGDVVVEVSGQVFNKPGYDPLAAARQCYNHLADAFSKAGLKRG